MKDTDLITDPLVDMAQRAGHHATRATLEAALTERQLQLHPGPTGPLLVRGTLPPAPIAIVGARAADPYGLTLSHRLAYDIGLRGIPIASGGAEGCDAEAHRGALDAGTPTVVVLPCGHDHPYPTHHAPLFDEIVSQGGAIVSAYWPTTPPRRHQFLARNALLAHLARGLIVVRAQRRSGTLSTARAAQRLQRPLATLPGPIGTALSEGCHLLIEQGAHPITSPQSLDRWLGLPETKASWPIHYSAQAAPWEARPPKRRPANPHAAAILHHLHKEPALDLDALAMRTGTSIASLAAQLLTLEIEGCLERRLDGRYQLAKRS